MPSRDFTSEDLFSSPTMSMPSSTHSSRAGNKLANLVVALAAERAMERVLRIAAAGLVHLSTPTRCESSRSLPCRPNHGHIAAAKLFGIEEVPTVRTSQHFS